MQKEYLIYFKGVFDKPIFTKACSTMFVDTDLHISYNSDSFCKLSINKYRQSYIQQLFDKLYNSKVIVKTTVKGVSKYKTLKDFKCQ